jgi:hypothetical protein
MTERAASPEANPNRGLGPLRQLQGIWVGHGFNIISLPVRNGATPPDHPPFLVKLNATIEELHFSLISSAEIPNRGFVQPDLNFLGLRYTSKVVDRNGEGGIHFEQGLWLFAPDPNVQPSLYRLASIPHGSTFLAANTEPVSAEPEPVTGGVLNFPVADPRPFPTNQPGNRITAPDYLDRFFQATVPNGLDPHTPPGPANPPGVINGAIGNPNLVLAEANAAHPITNTTTFTVSSDAENLRSIPFLSSNAKATSMTATFWISEFRGLFGIPILKLQYSQTVILNFDNTDWPHISVASLIMPFG